MTPKTAELAKEREAFETWAHTKRLNTVQWVSEVGPYYVDESTDTAWQAWQEVAARSTAPAVAVQPAQAADLREAIPPSAMDWLTSSDPPGCASTDWIQGWDACRNRVAMNAAASLPVESFAIEVEKLLCTALGRKWSATGISIETLIAELTARVPAAASLAGEPTIPPVGDGQPEKLLRQIYNRIADTAEGLALYHRIAERLGVAATPAQPPEQPQGGSD